MTLPTNIRWIILGGLALLLIGLGLGYLAFYSPTQKPDVITRTEYLKTPAPPPVLVPGKPIIDTSGHTTRVDTLYIYVPCPEMSSPLAKPIPKADVFTSLPDLTPHAHMPAFTIHKSAPLIQFGAKLGMAPVQGFWAGGLMARLALGDFHIVTEIGLMQHLFYFLVSLEVYFYSIL